MHKILIRKPAARLILESVWYQGQDATVTETGYLDSIRQAATSKYRHDLRISSMVQVESILSIVDPVLDELQATGVKATTTQPLLDMKNDVTRHVEYIKRREAQEAKEKKEKEALDADSNRRWATEHREETLSLYVENGRGAQFRQICEDYGLNYKDVQIRAALIAAFHVGANNFQNAVGHLAYGFPNWTEVQEKTVHLAEADKKVFDAARAKADAAKTDS